jgi:hypothetical protein
MTIAIGRAARVIQRMRPAPDAATALFAVGHAIAGANPASAVDAALAEIGPCFDADRAWLIRFDPALTQFWVAHEWCADGVAAFLPDFPGAPISLLALPMLHFRRGRAVVYADIEKLPPDAQPLKEEMRREGNRATAGAPQFRGKRLVALIGLDDVRRIHRWSAAEMELLQQLGDIVLTAADRVVPLSPVPHLAAPIPNGCYLRTGNSHIHVSWSEIISICAEGDYTRVRLHNGREFLELKGLTIWESMLPQSFFGRIHRSSIVGWRHLERLDRSSGGRWSLHLRDHSVLPVGRQYQSAVRTQINLHGS